MELLTAMPVSICLLDCSELEIRRMDLRCVSFMKSLCLIVWNDCLGMICIAAEFKITFICFCSTSRQIITITSVLSLALNVYQLSTIQLSSS